MSERSVLVVAHTGRPEALEAATEAVGLLRKAGLSIRALAAESGELSLPDDVEVVSGTNGAHGSDLVVVLGGDGTSLRGAEVPCRYAGARGPPRHIASWPSPTGRLSYPARVVRRLPRRGSG